MSVFNAVSVVIDAALLVSWGVMLALYLRRGTPQTARGPEREALETAIDELSQANAKAEAAIAVKNRFLESASYQLRTPLNTILGLSEMVASGFCGPCDNAKVGEYLNDIHASGLELLTVIDKLSAVATVEATANAARHSYRTIFEMSPDGMCLCRDGVVTFINSAGVRLLGGYDASQFEGKAFADFIHGADRSWAENNFATLIGEAHSTPMQLAHPGGKALDVVLTAAAVPDGDDIVLVVIRNISDVTRANRDVAAQVKRLNSILDTAVDAIVVCDERGLIETFNRSAEVMFGYTAADAIGRNVTILMTERDAFDHHRNIGRYAHTHESQVIGVGREVSAQRKDGSGFPAEISLSVCYLDDRRLFTAMIRDVTERRTFENHLAYSANHDALTSLPNRNLLAATLQQDVDRAAASGAWVAVWFVDLDGFKTINDVMGHAAGDELLIEAGRRMLASIKPADTVARFGGDEFALIITDVRSQADVIAAMETFLSAVTQPFLLRGQEVALTANVGISLYPGDTVTASDLVVNAGAAMIVAKAAGRNLYRFFDPSMHHESSERLTLENELRRGIERDELMLHYQPQVDIASGAIVGLEALVRWNHPNMGMVSPNRFIPVAEQTGLIVPLGEWVLHQACKDLRRLEDMGIDGVSVAVNISPRQFSDSDVLGLIHHVIAETGVDPGRLDVEITEGTLMNDPEHVIAYLEQLKGQGIRLSIDDFGTGYSSLNYLKRFPVDTLKIDRSFVVDIADNAKDEAIALTIITLAHSMGMTVLAEGVEFAAQGDLLGRLGCDVIQGFLYSRPLPFEQIVAILRGGIRLPILASTEALQSSLATGSPNI